MANNFKEIKTRIALKQNTYEYWITGAGKDYIPLYGEVCFCEIPAPEENQNPQTNGSQEATNAPTVLFKVGTAQKNADGSWVAGTDKKFSELNWVSALAADVYDWAKQSPDKFLEWLGEQDQLAVIWDTEDYKGTKTYTLAEYAEEVIGNPSNLATISKNLVGAINEAYQAVNVGGIGSVVTIAKLATPTTGSYATYQLYQGVDDNNHPIAVGTKIEIPMPTISKAETPTEGAQATYEIKYGNTTANGKIDIPESAKVEASDKNGYIKVDDEDVVVYDEIFGVDMATVNALGGIAAGTNLKDKTIHEVLNALLFPYVAPVVGQPSRTPSTTAALEKGNDQTVTSVTAKVTKKSEPIVKVELIKGDSTVIATKEGSELPNITTSGTNVTFSGLSVSVPSSSVTFKVRATDATGKSTTSSASAGWTFVYPYFYGICAGGKTAATLTEADIEAMTKDIKGRGEKSYEYKNMDNQKMVIAYPKAHGTLKKALDPNNFDYIEAYDRAELTITGLDGSAQVYYVYAQKDPTYGTTTMKYQY